MPTAIDQLLASIIDRAAAEVADTVRQTSYGDDALQALPVDDDEIDIRLLILGSFRASAVFPGGDEAG